MSDLTQTVTLQLPLQVVINRNQNAGAFQAALDAEIVRIINGGAQPEDSEAEAVDHPDHYNQHAMECIDALRLILTKPEFRGFCLGNMVKYRWRRGGKGKAGEDMKKADWYESELSVARGEEEILAREVSRAECFIASHR